MITTFRRSVLKSAGMIWPQLIGYLVYTIVISIIYIKFNVHFISIEAVHISMLATAVTLFLSFRNNSAYDRWWEARKLWGALVNNSRQFAAQIVTLIREDNCLECYASRRRMIYRHLAYINALRLQLRDQNECSELRKFLSEEEYNQISKIKNKAAYLNKLQAAELSRLRSEGILSDYTLISLQSNLRELYDSQGGAERIKNTPFPVLYNFGTRLVHWTFAALLPFAFIETIGYKTIILSSVISFVLYEVSRIGLVMQDPFKNHPNDIPMSAICIAIEIDLLTMLGEDKIPGEAEIVEGVLM